MVPPLALSSSSSSSIHDFYPRTLHPPPLIHPRHDVLTFLKYCRTDAFLLEDILFVIPLLLPLSLSLSLSLSVPRSSASLSPSFIRVTLLSLCECWNWSHTWEPVPHGVPSSAHMLRRKANGGDGRWPSEKYLVREEERVYCPTINGPPKTAGYRRLCLSRFSSSPSGHSFSNGLSIAVSTILAKSKGYVLGHGEMKLQSYKVTNRWHFLETVKTPKIRSKRWLIIFHVELMTRAK